MSRIAVLAIGGNSLIKDRLHQSVRDQYVAAQETCHHIASMIEDGWSVAIGHGNGPQVGFILRRSELAAHELHEVPLDVCGADSQGAIGYALQQNLENDLRRKGLSRPVATVITQVEVAADDPAFKNPSKPIGYFYSEEEARALHDELGWEMREDSGRGWRYVVPSPQPKHIADISLVQTVAKSGAVVIAGGGGGIPVVRGPKGVRRGVEAVIDKDRTSALMANVLKIDDLMILSPVSRVAINFGKPNQQALDQVTLGEMRRYHAEGHFPPGSMGPKVDAAIHFLENGGRHVMIGRLEEAMAVLRGETGTHIFADA
jgi:carbamate kinase